MGVKWGESQTSVKQKILSRKESPKLLYETPFNLKFTNLVLADKILTNEGQGNCLFYFYSKGLYQVICSASNEESNDLYRNLESLIIEKHGQPWMTLRDTNDYDWRSRDGRSIRLTYLITSEKKYIILIAYKNDIMRKEVAQLRHLEGGKSYPTN